MRKTHSIKNKQLDDDDDDEDSKSGASMIMGALLSKS